MHGRLDAGLPARADWQRRQQRRIVLATMPPGAVAPPWISANTDCSAGGRHASWTKSEMTILLILDLGGLIPYLLLLA